MKNPEGDRKEPPFFEPYPGSVLLLQARYVLAIGQGGEIALPGEVRWGFALNEGDQLIWERRGNELTLTSHCRTVLAALDACEAPWPVLEREALNRPMERVTPGGTVRLPEEYRTETGLRPGDRVELDARIDGLKRELVVRPRIELSAAPARGR